MLLSLHLLKASNVVREDTRAAEATGAVAKMGGSLGRNVLLDACPHELTKHYSGVVAIVQLEFENHGNLGATDLPVNVGIRCCRGCHERVVRGSAEVEWGDAANSRNLAVNRGGWLLFAKRDLLRHVTVERVDLGVINLIN